MDKTSNDSGLRRRDVKKKTDSEYECKDAEYQKLVMKRLRKSFDEKIRQTLDKIEKEIFTLKHRIVHEVEGIDMQNESHVEAFVEKAKLQNLRSGKKGDLFEEKNFQFRESLLTVLLQVPHIRTIYHIFVAFLVNLVINTALHDYVKDGKVTMGFRVIYWSFKELPSALSIWLVMQLSTVLVYFCFVSWSTVRRKIDCHKFLLRLWDSASLLLLVVYDVLMLTIPTVIIMLDDFKVVLSFALLTEQVRFVMKTHSFVRSCTPRVLAQEVHQKSVNPGQGVPSFNKFIYFLFVPTLIYRDEYPRSSKTRWSSVFFHFAEVIGSIFFLAFLYENYMVHLMRDFGKAPASWEEIMVIFFGINIPALLYFLLGFFLLLHSWMNAFAEMLRFGDRMYYQDWWNAGSFPEYYKKWNIIVHDWLYTFIYRDATIYVTKSKAASTWLVFIVSALFHEFILAFTFRFCYPVLFIVFGILSTCLYFIPNKCFHPAGNFMIWMLLMIGVGFCAGLYFLEYFARINCPPISSSPVVDFFVPRSWMCGMDTKN